MHDLDESEYKIINDKGIDFDTLYIIVHFKKNIRNKIYGKIQDFLLLRQPISAIRTFVNDEIIEEYEKKLQMVSGEFWMAISSYLKARDITKSPMSVNFRSMIYKAGNFVKTGKLLSTGQIEWIAESIIFDHDSELGIFLNDGNLSTYPKDCKLLKEIVELIKGIL